MLRKAYLILAALAFLADAPAVQKAEVQFQGRPISAWLADRGNLEKPDGLENAKAVLANYCSGSKANLTIIAGYLESDDHHARWGSLLTLGDHRAQIAHLKPKIQAVIAGSPHASLRRFLLELLGRVAPNEEGTITTALRRLSTDADDAVRWTAVSVIRNSQALGKDALDGLTKALSDSSLIVALQAVHALVEHGDHAKLVDAVLKAGKKRPTEYDRKVLAQALGNVKPSNIELLMGHLRDQDPAVRSMTLYALESMYRQQEEGNAREKLEKVVPRILGMLKDKDNEARKSAVRTLSVLRPRREVAEAPLIAALQDSDADVRGLAARALRKCSPLPENAIAALTRTLGDATSWVRCEAAETLAEMGPEAGKAAVPVLRQRALHDDGNEVARCAALRALGKIGRPALPVVTDLEMLLKTTKGPVQEAVIEALKEIQAQKQ